MTNMGRGILRLTLIASVLASVFLATGIATAGPSEPSPIDEQAQGKVSHGSIRVDRKVIKASSREKKTAPKTTATSETITVSQMMSAFCLDASNDVAASGGATQTIVDLCVGFAVLPVAPSREEVLRAFRELPLYRGVIQTDPRVATLVNLETFFWCGDGGGRGCDVVGEGERTVTLLGQGVRIRPRIVSYAWDFGDGVGVDAGGEKVAHTYGQAGTVTVTLTLTWTADYAVGGGGFQPIGGTTTTTSPARALPVREAEAIIVGDN